MRTELEWNHSETARLIDRCRQAADAHHTATAATLDGVAAALGAGYQSRGRDIEHALTTLAALAVALGVPRD